MIVIKSPAEIAIMREGGKILNAVLKEVVRAVKPGVATGELNNLAEQLIQKAGGAPSFKNYKNASTVLAFPTALCASINDEIVHAPAVPSRVLNAGDIISLDLGLKYKGYFTDMAVTVPVGKISGNAQRLIAVTKKALQKAIQKVKPGNELFDISRAVQDYVESFGYTVIRNLVGHGVGKAVHEMPQIPNFVSPKEFKNIRLRPGMTLAIEPMVTKGNPYAAVMEDGWTMSTADNSLSAHFEHTVAVVEGGCEVLTG
ncbi:MAG: type I methionyl aminopeptidase [Candidatus Doudnabacteria bacterium]|nr:type I methionyl aminopeptidase [Candidatus Doudnabacteria bacterium]